ncbi:MAG: hypothetical protein AAGA91_19620 [Pseudomonadota bacterium]
MSTINSLGDVLALKALQADLTLQAAQQEDSEVRGKLAITPSAAGYALQGQLKARKMQLDVQADSSETWTLPVKSALTLDQLRPNALATLLGQYFPHDRQAQTDTSFNELLAGTVPRLSLPVHTAQIAIEKVRLPVLLVEEVHFTLNTGANGVTLSGLQGTGPAGLLSGNAGIVSSDSGWQVRADVLVTARDTESGLGAQLVDIDWRWHDGEVDLSGQGVTWGELINTLKGKASFSGAHVGTTRTPVSVKAELDSSAGKFALPQLTAKLGDGTLTGSLSLDSRKPRTLTADIKGKDLNLSFLMPDDEDTPEETDSESSPHGVPLPHPLTLYPELLLDLKLDVTNLKLPALDLKRVAGTATRNPSRGQFQATLTGRQNGTLVINLDAQDAADGKDTLTLNMQFNQLDSLSAFWRQDMLHTRSSGSIDFTSTGEGVNEIFESLRGRADLDIEIRRDNDWTRTAGDREKLHLGGSARFVLDGDYITGVEIKDLDVDTFEQDLTGDVTLTAGGSPWLKADLKSKALNLANLMDLLPEDSDNAAQGAHSTASAKTDSTTPAKSSTTANASSSATASAATTGNPTDAILRNLRLLGDTRIDLSVDSLTLREEPFSSLTLQFLSSADSVQIQNLSMTARGNSLKGNAKLSWQGDTSLLKSNLELDNVNLDQFVITNPNHTPIPVTGTVTLNAEGTTMDTLLGSINGEVELAPTQTTAANRPQDRRRLSLVAKRTSNGMQADIKAFQLGLSTMTGAINYTAGDPALWDVDVTSGSLDLTAWEQTTASSDSSTQKRGDGSAITSAAKASADFVEDFLLTPIHWLRGDAVDRPPKDERIFSEDPLPLDDLNAVNLALTGKLESFNSVVIAARNIQMQGKANADGLSFSVSSQHASDGTANTKLRMDRTQQMPHWHLESTFENMRGVNDRDTFPRSGHVKLHSRGQSAAQIAKNTDGIVYLKFGRGPLDYSESRLLTRDIATSVFTALIPGSDDSKPEMRCGVALGLFKNGKGITPYGAAVRTDEANLLARIEIDLHKETLKMSIDSRSRKGVGLSVGNVFSNTILVEGPLDAPKIVPNTTGILWRGWAAIMTAGMSIVGESVLKRALAAEDPCDSIQKLIDDKFCPKHKAAADSSMVCPVTHSEQTATSGF